MKKLSWIFGVAAAIGVGYLALRPRTPAPPETPPPTGPWQTQTVTAAAPTNKISVVSFNIQFLGNSRERDDRALASILKGHDVVVVQELVAPPYSGTYPNGAPFKPDPQAAEFFDEMKGLGFRYILSEENTGAVTGKNGSAAEWFVAFYKPETIEPAPDLPHGFLQEDRSDNPDFERVPYAFSFRTPEKDMDFVLISVHLQPDASGAARRRHEINSIAVWISAQGGAEKDYIVLGDMNIENRAELARVMPAGYASLNARCEPTNTNVKGPKPYDHVFYHIQYTGPEIDAEFGFRVMNLIELMRAHWPQSQRAPYPGEPYNHNEFRKYYSDHHPVVFRFNRGLDRD